jgi:drug/metabolite transporter (DMT)-like permease
MKNGTWEMVAAMVMSGTIGAFVVASGQTPLTVVLFRCLLGGAALLAWLAWRGEFKPMPRRDFLWLLAGGAALLLNWLCLFSAYALSSISVATIVFHMQPFFLVLFAALQGEAPTRAKLPWLVVAFAGVALTTGLEGGGNILLGVGLALMGALLYAVATLITRKLKGYAPAQVAGLQLAIGGVVLAPFAEIALADFSSTVWLCLTVIGLVHTGVMYNLMYAAFQRLRADVIATLAFIYPAVAVVVDVVVFDTRPGAWQAAGMAMILAAVAANQWITRRG